jgi:hypothetical protein
LALVIAVRRFGESKNLNPIQIHPNNEARYEYNEYCCDEPLRAFSIATFGLVIFQCRRKQARPNPENVLAQLDCALGLTRSFCGAPPLPQEYTSVFGTWSIGASGPGGTMDAPPLSPLLPTAGTLARSPSVALTAAEMESDIVLEGTMYQCYSRVCLFNMVLLNIVVVSFFGNQVCY